MTNQEILIKAIEKAITGGWLYDGRLPIDSFNVPGAAEFIYFGHEDTKYADYSVADLIYRHDFAKALWGEPKRIVASFTTIKHPDPKIFGGWHYHLQQMVVADDPIKYLVENI